MLAHRHRHDPARRAELDGVRQQVRADPHEVLLHDPQGDGVVHAPQLDVHVAGRRHDAQRVFDAVRQQAHEIDVFGRAAARHLGAEAAELEHVLDHVGEPPGVAVDDLTGLLGLGVELVVVDELLRESDDARHGRAQLVADRGDEVVLLLVELPQVIGDPLGIPLARRQRFRRRVPIVRLTRDEEARRGVRHDEQLQGDDRGARVVTDELGERTDREARRDRRREGEGDRLHRRHERGKAEGPPHERRDDQEGEAQGGSGGEHHERQQHESGGLHHRLPEGNPQAHRHRHQERGHEREDRARVGREERHHRDQKVGAAEQGRGNAPEESHDHGAGASAEQEPAGLRQGHHAHPRAAALEHPDDDKGLGGVRDAVGDAERPPAIGGEVDNDAQGDDQQRDRDPAATAREQRDHGESGGRPPDRDRDIGRDRVEAPPPQARERQQQQGEVRAPLPRRHLANAGGDAAFIHGSSSTG